MIGKSAAYRYSFKSDHSRYNCHRSGNCRGICTGGTTYDTTHDATCGSFHGATHDTLHDATQGVRLEAAHMDAKGRPGRNATAKTLLAVAVTLLSAILLSSCSTMNSFDSSSEECDYAMHYVLGKANESTMSKLFFRITQTSTFLPDDLQFMEQSKDEIPGMPKLLDEWTQSISTYTLDWFEGFKEYTSSLVENIEFQDPEALVHEGDTSGARTVESVYGEDIASYVKTTLEGADLSKWDELATQYNAWVTTRKALYGEEIQSLGDVDLVGDMSQYIKGLYFEELKAAEELLRTTPDPNADPVVSKVFGLE